MGSTRRCLIGRDRELALLHDVFADLDNGPHLVLVDGAPGSGKSGLIDDFCADLDPSTFVGLRGRCQPGGRAASYGVFAEALRPFDRIPALVGGTEHGAFHAIVHGVAATHAEAALSRSKLFTDVLSMLSDLDQRVVLVIDDLHWIDAASAELLGFIARNLRAEPLMVVVVVRTGVQRADVTRALIAELRRSPIAVQLHVGPLGEEALTALLETTRGERPTIEEVTALGRASGGNARIASSLARSFDQPDCVSRILKNLLADELAELSPDALLAIRLCAVAGDRIDRQLLAVAVSDVNVGGAVREAVDAEILFSEGPALRLRHAPYRDAILADIPIGTTAVLHARIADAGEKLDDPAILATADIARHWLDARDPGRAVPALKAAAQLAMGNFKFREADDLWTTVIRVLGPEPPAGPEYEDALAAAAQAARWTGDLERATTLLTTALSRTGAMDDVIQVKYYVQRATIFQIRGLLTDARWDIERAVGLVAAWPDDLKANARAGLTGDVIAEYARIIQLCGHSDSAARLARNAADLAHRCGRYDIEARALATLGLSLGDLDEVALAELALRESRHLALTFGDFADQIQATANLALFLLHTNRVREGLAAAAESCEVAHRVGVGALSGAASTAECTAITALIHLGRWDRARQRVKQHMDRPFADPSTRGWMLVTAAQLAAVEGDTDRASAWLSEAEPLIRSQRNVGVRWTAAAAEIALCRHRLNEAVDVTLSGLTHGLSAADRGYLLSWTFRALGTMVDTARRRRDFTGVTTAIRKAQDVLERYGRGLLSRDADPFTRDRLRAEYARAIGKPTIPAWDAVLKHTVERPYDRAYAQLRRAEVVAETAAHLDEHSARQLVEAHQTATMLGSRPLRADVELLAACTATMLGADPLTPEGDDGVAINLTAREREVLAALKAGLTNRRIARTLSITEKTASVHVSNILAKLGVANRSAAAAMAHQLDM